LDDEQIVDKTYWSKMPKLTIISASLIWGAITFSVYGTLSCRKWLFFDSTFLVFILFTLAAWPSRPFRSEITLWEQRGPLHGVSLYFGHIWQTQNIGQESSYPFVFFHYKLFLFPLNGEPFNDRNREIVLEWGRDLIWGFWQREISWHSLSSLSNYTIWRDRSIIALGSSRFKWLFHYI
jgi:hypothetical protein